MDTTISPHAEQAFNDFIDTNNEPIVLCGAVIPASAALKGVKALREEARATWVEHLLESILERPEDHEAALIEAGEPYRAAVNSENLKSIHQRFLHNLRTNPEKYIDPAHELNLVAAARDAYAAELTLTA